MPDGDTFTTCESIFTENVDGPGLYTDLSVLGPDIRRSIDQMIIFDAIINNTDRHTRNFGFLKSENGNFRLAPLFDHGLALLSEFSEHDLEEHGAELMSFGKGQPFGHLMIAVKHIDRDSVDNIKFDVPVDELYKIVDSFAGVITPRRIKLMKRVLEVRWNHVRKLFSQV